jgi:hypothetical protein
MTEMVSRLASHSLRWRGSLRVFSKYVRFVNGLGIDGIYSSTFGMLGIVGGVFKICII